MKNRSFFLIFLVLGFLLCLIPSVLMAGFRSDEPIGNETLSSLPKFVEDGDWNINILSDLGNWFETHYAFRPALITADAKIQSALFRISNTDPVVTGNEDWLYYSSTLNDYLGRTYLSERGMWNLAHNMALIQQYVVAKGAKFLFMVPANKNTLYPRFMPYYYQSHAGNIHNRDSLGQVLSVAHVNYLDLFELFGEQEEILYLKHDSHWNNKGARLVYDTALTMMEKAHESYETEEPVYAPIHQGDLSDMIYPADASLEYDYQYAWEQAYEYIPNFSSSDPVSVEDFRIETVNETAADHLLMYRDSFSNTLIPFLSNEFAHAYYSKSVPYTLARDMQQYEPHYVIVELVERNIQNLAKNPAVVPAPRVNPDRDGLNCIDAAETDIALCMADTSFVAFTGTIPDGEAEPNARIYLAVYNSQGEAAFYEGFTLTTEESDYGYAVYLPLAQFGTLEIAQNLRVEIYIGLGV